MHQTWQFKLLIAQRCPEELNLSLRLDENGFQVALRSLITPYILRRTKARVAKHLPDKTVRMNGIFHVDNSFVTIIGTRSLL